MGHIIERAPGNLATQLRTTHGGTAQSQFLTGVTDAPPQPDSEWASAFAVTQQQPLQVHWAGQPGAQAAQATAESYAAQAQAYPLFEDEDSGNGTDTDTASSCGNTEYLTLHWLPLQLTLRCPIFVLGL